MDNIDNKDKKDKIEKLKEQLMADERQRKRDYWRNYDRKRKIKYECCIII